MSEHGRVKIVGATDTDGYVTVTRTHPSGRVWTVRNAELLQTSGGAFLVYDYELPIGVPVTYTAYLYADQYGANLIDQSNEALVTWQSESEWLKDPIEPVRNLPVTTTGSGNMQYESRSGVHPVLNRPAPIVVTETRNSASDTLTFYAPDADTYRRIDYILSSGNPLLFQSTQESRYGNFYFAPMTQGQTRVTQYRHDPRGFLTVECQEVDPPIGLANGTTTYADALAAAPLYSDANEMWTTYLDMIENLVSAAGPPTITWRGA